MSVPTNPPKKKELSMEMRMLLAFLLMGLVFAVTPMIFKQDKPAAKKADPQPAAQTAVAAAAAPAAPAKPAKTPDGKTPPPTPAGTVAAAQAQTYTVENDLYKVVFSNRGATIRSWNLKKYKDINGKTVELVNEFAAPKAGWPMALLFKDGKQRPDINQALFVATPSSDGLSINFEYSDGAIAVRKSFAFTKDKYRLQVSSEVTETGSTVPHLLAWRGGFGDRTVHNAYSTQHSLRYDATASKLEINEAKAAKDGPVTASGQFSFGGIEDTFFAAVYLGQPGQSMDVQTWDDKVAPPGEKDEASWVGAAVGSGAAANNFTLFVGPKDLDVLKQVDPKLQGLVDYGWFAIIARPLFQALHWTNDNLINNWGWSIVFVTIIINCLLLPLRFSSVRSMQKMSSIQPEVQLINEKYKNVGMRDPKAQQKNEELMALYSKHGINPMGGCVPMILQMPFFFAFYKVLSVSIELRGAPWLWVSDLSQPENMFIRILPILMIVTQVLMQKMTPATSPDPNQQRMMLLMPVMLGFLFYTASSGLVLYWLTGNVVGIFQQLFFNRIAKAPAAVSSAAISAATPKKKKS